MSVEIQKIFKEIDDCVATHNKDNWGGEDETGLSAETIKNIELFKECFDFSLFKEYFNSCEGSIFYRDLKYADVGVSNSGEFSLSFKGGEVDIYIDDDFFYFFNNKNEKFVLNTKQNDIFVLKCKVDSIFRLLGIDYDDRQGQER